MYLSLHKPCYVKTQFRSKPENWDISEFNSKESNYQTKNVLIRRMLNAVELFLLKDEANRMSDKTIREKVLEIVTGGSQGEKKTLIYWCGKTEERKRGQSTKQNVRSVAKLIMAFDAKCTLASVDTKWLHEFIRWMEEERNIKHNSCITYIDILRSVFNTAIDEGATSIYPFRRLNMHKEPTRKRALSIERLADIALAKPQKKKGELARDIFMLIFYLIGINMADLVRATWKDVRDGRLEYKRAKTGRLYSIKLEPEALAIIKKYKGKERLLKEFERNVIEPVHIQMVNKWIRDVSGLPDITTYWARHSWATIAASLDIPKETISAALGHELGSKITSIYIDFDQKKVDEANRKVINHLNAVLEKRKK
jgi:integrase